MTTQGKRLTKIRKALNLTQEEFAKKFGISRQIIANTEADRLLLNNEKLEILYKEFNVNLNYLFGGIGTMFNKTSEEKEEIHKLFNEMIREEYERRKLNR